MRIGAFLGGLTLFLIHGWAGAQPFGDRALAQAIKGPDLRFPDQAATLSFFSPLAMAIYRPAGTGPFPALVVAHTCGGLRAELQDWAKLALERGYVVFVIDSLSSRGVSAINGCNPATWVTPARGTRDVFQAREHLRKFDFVDQNRVALVGFSWGAMVGLYASSNGIAGQLAASRYGAVIGMYPFCYFPGGGGFREAEWLRADTDRPLLVLLGEQDTEAPPADCVSRLEKLKQKNAPVDWHVYPGTTHCWDCSSLDNFSKTGFQGQRIVYRYDRQVMLDSAERMFAFLALHLKPDR